MINNAGRIEWTPTESTERPQEAVQAWRREALAECGHRLERLTWRVCRSLWAPYSGTRIASADADILRAEGLMVADMLAIGGTAITPMIRVPIFNPDNDIDPADLDDTSGGIYSEEIAA